MFRVVILSATNDWCLDQSDKVFLAAATYHQNEDYFGLVQLLLDTLGIVPGMPFDVQQWNYEISLSDNERTNLDFALKAGKFVGGRNWRRDAKAWVMTLARAVKDGSQSGTNRSKRKSKTQRQGEKTLHPPKDVPRSNGG